MKPRRASELPPPFSPRVLAVLAAHGIDLDDPATRAAFRDGVRDADEAAREFGYSTSAGRTRTRSRRAGRT